jgi:hypothetical protein
MSKSLTIWALIGILGAAGCMTEGQFLASRQPTAIQSAVSRGQFEMNCPSATGEVLSQEFTQPAIQGPLVQGESRGLFTIGVAGCGQRRSTALSDGEIVTALKVTRERNSGDGFGARAPGRKGAMLTILKPEAAGIG